MICPKCGKELGEGVINCRECNPPPSESDTVVVGEAPKSGNVCAVIGFILACFSLVPGITLVVSSASIPFVIPSFVLCVIGLKKAKELKSGRGFAVWGIVICIVSLIIAVVFNVILPVVAAVLGFFGTLLTAILGLLGTALTGILGVLGTAAQMGAMESLTQNLDESQIQSSV